MTTIENLPHVETDKLERDLTIFIELIKAINDAQDGDAKKPLYWRMEKNYAQSVNNLIQN